MQCIKYEQVKSTHRGDQTLKIFGPPDWTVSMYTLLSDGESRLLPSISRLLKIIGLFCKRALQKRLYSAKETYNFKDPITQSDGESRLLPGNFQGSPVKTYLKVTGTQWKLDRNFGSRNYFVFDFLCPWTVCGVSESCVYPKASYKRVYLSLPHSITRVMQCVAVCCRVLRGVAVCCSVLQCVAVCCSVYLSLPHSITRVMQCVAARACC